MSLKPSQLSQVTTTTSVTLENQNGRLFLTVDPSNTNRLKNCKEQKSHPSAGIVVKQLENIQASLKIRCRVSTEKVHYKMLRMQLL